MVKIGTEEDREAIVKTVRAAMERMNRLCRQFPDGVPVTFDEAEASWIIEPSSD